MSPRSSLIIQEDRWATSPTINGEPTLLEERLMRMCRGHVVELLLVVALTVMASPLVAQPDTFGMCHDGQPADSIEGGEFLLLKNRADADWRASWQTFRSANPHIDFGEKRVISFSPNDTRIPFYVRELLCGLSKAGYEIRPTQVVSHDDDPSLSPIHKAVHSVKSRPERILGIGWIVVTIGSIWLLWWLLLIRN
jgi:hypothetical protein